MLIRKWINLTVQTLYEGMSGCHGDGASDQIHLQSKIMPYFFYVAWSKKYVFDNWFVNMLHYESYKSLDIMNAFFITNVLVPSSCGQSKNMLSGLKYKSIGCSSDCPSTGQQV